jgi:crotonobetainyl-CoA:carnitine CoA-transferase CaiB-like acyl-CoA transferase
MSAPHGPLQGLKVVSCSTAQAGTVPWMLMADLGADVIKIETPDGGDSSRRHCHVSGICFQILPDSLQRIVTLSIT